MIGFRKSFHPLTRNDEIHTHIICIDSLAILEWMNKKVKIHFAKWTQPKPKEAYMSNISIDWVHHEQTEIQRFIKVQFHFLGFWGH